MSSLFPLQFDLFVNPSASSKMSDPGVAHHRQHANANDAIVQIQRKIGTDSSTDPLSIDSKLTQLQLRQLNFTGDVSGSGVTSIPLVLASTGIVAGSYGGAGKTFSVTVDTKGRITEITEAPSGLRLSVAVVDSDITLTDQDYYLKCDASNSNIVVTLPEESVSLGQNYRLVKTDNSINTISIRTHAGVQIFVLDDIGDKVAIICDGSSWDNLN
jgi:hypothetical protein